MIAAKELRINNIVWMISKQKEYVIDRGQDIDNSEDFNPIPLTEERLLKFGYIKHGNNYTIQGNSVWICNDLFMCDKNGIILKSVHQLQNLYFALTNKELSYKEDKTKKNKNDDKKTKH